MSDGEITWLRAAVLAAQNLRTHLSKAQRKRGFNLKRDIVPEIKRIYNFRVRLCLNL